MPKITFIDYQGNQTEVEANTGSSLMEAAVDNDVSGIDADCGGACACATCHVYVDQNWLDKVGKPDDLEVDMLDVADGVQENSRLSCQIQVIDELDGLVVSTPESQF